MLVCVTVHCRCIDFICLLGIGFGLQLNGAAARMLSVRLSVRLLSVSLCVCVSVCVPAVSVVVVRE